MSLLQLTHLRPAARLKAISRGLSVAACLGRCARRCWGLPSRSDIDAAGIASVGSSKVDSCQRLTCQLVRASRTSRCPDSPPHLLGESGLKFTQCSRPSECPDLHERLTLILCESAAVVRLATQSSVTSPAGGQHQGSALNE